MPVSVTKQKPDITNQEKSREVGGVFFVILRWHDPVYVIEIQLLIELFSQNIQCPIMTSNPPSMLIFLGHFNKKIWLNITVKLEYLWKHKF